ncbi:N-acetyl-gamma-glutamyl-phosphate reductase [Robertmurraya siralis]|uniref:N-acetyl-gamma-glutamyl-phosphate reductase n=1 Tax=Robertmurraya siralis TaxID=77777 RepID=A0A919WJM5_9BACI|nr:N-acetyl-gamma-glutamyl-phosphate reductase [Robertmurraya siralis]PAE20638.1 N-acetyl-gamma-glutamyl-phosphate reductase [Bacillus sp. 7504-2]GIN62941.1 N-acetyl-gamma-glutamyl-phosphate reductase [Robertmurraya siralis]
MKISIIGTTGYGGVELLRILHHHPVFKIQSIHSTKDEVPIWHEYPHLYQVLGKQLEKIDVEEISLNSDLVFLATPSGVSSKLAAQFLHHNIRVIDLSGDLRLKEPGEYEAWYKKTGADQSIVEEAVYGLSEWNEKQIEKARFIANPGCYATAVLLGLAPVAKEKLIVPDSIIIDGKSGTSGAGKSLSKASLFAEVNENFKIYKVNEHQHTPEIEQQLLEWDENIEPITFSTHLLPMTRGIMTTIYVKLRAQSSTEQLVDLYKEAYKGKPFVRVRPHGNYPAVKEVQGSNYCDIGLNVDERTGRLTIVSVIDNLMKGAAGQAVQNANILNRLNPATGLEMLPLYP